MTVAIEKVQLKEEELLCFHDAKRYNELGLIGHLRGDFDRGNSFYTTWFDGDHPERNDDNFKSVFDAIINDLRSKGGVLENRSSMTRYCTEHKDCHNSHSYTDKCYEFRVLTKDYALYLRCMPEPGDYNFYCYAYDKNMLFSELAKQRGLPLYCYGYLPTTKEEIRIDFATSGYTPYRTVASGCSANEMNREIGVTKAQAEAMKCGSMVGWNTPAAEPKCYDENGKMQNQRKKTDREER